MKTTNFSYRDIAIHADAYLKKALKKPRPESTFQVGESKIKIIRKSSKCFDEPIQLSNRDAPPTLPSPLRKVALKLQG